MTPCIFQPRVSQRRSVVYLNYHLQPVVKGSRSYVKDSRDILQRLKHLGKVPSNVILVTADVVDLFPSIPDEARLKALYEKLEESVGKKSPSSDFS